MGLTVGSTQIRTYQFGRGLNQGFCVSCMGKRACESACFRSHAAQLSRVLQSGQGGVWHNLRIPKFSIDGWGVSLLDWQYLPCASHRDAALQESNSAHKKRASPPTQRRRSNQNRKARCGPMPQPFRRIVQAFRVPLTA